VSYLCIGIPTYGSDFPGTDGDGCVLISQGIGRANKDYYFNTVSLCNPADEGCPMSLDAQALILADTGGISPLPGVTVNVETNGAHSGSLVPQYAESQWCNAVPGGDPNPVTVSGSGSSFTISQSGLINPTGGGGPSACVIDFYDNYGDSLQVELNLLTVEQASVNVERASGGNNHRR
jgi:hypothetical protein